MPSLDFEQEKKAFRKYYDSNQKQFAAAKDAYINIVRTLTRQFDVGEVTKIEGRVKDREECIRKFQRKYQSKLEADEQPYEIKDFMSDLIGLRIVCLYEDQVPVVSELLQRHFRILNVTDKISAVESTEDSFGYKGFHMDLALDAVTTLPKHLPHAESCFEVQIRSLIQDAWSMLDHKIKYKRSIPNDLKRRINVLSALFELADREFKEIRNATADLLQQATVAPISEPLEGSPEASEQTATAASGTRTVNAFNFQPIAGHFFRDFDFEDYKVDDFVQDILEHNPGFQKSDLHRCLNENLKTVREYRDYVVADNHEKTFSAYTLIRHCLYLYDPENFSRILSRRTRERFAGWLKVSRDTQLDPE